MNTSVAPALNLWRDLDEQGISASQGGLEPVDTVLDVLQRTVVLVGNASNYISQCRRDNVITNMKFRPKGLASVMKSVCKKHKPEGDLLFGSEVHKALTERAEMVSTLKKVATKIQEPAKSKHTPSGPNDRKLFEGARLSNTAEGRAKFTGRKIDQDLSISNGRTTSQLQAEHTNPIESTTHATESSFSYIPEQSAPLCGRKAQIFQTQLGGDRYRLLDLTTSLRIPSSFCDNTTPVVSYTPNGSI